MADCGECYHSCPETCGTCGGKNGYPATGYPKLIGPCDSCNARGPTPAEMAAAVQSYLMCHPDDLAAINLGGQSLSEWLESHPEQVAAMYSQWNLG